MDVQIETATPQQAATVAALVMDLTAEISQRCNAQFHRDTGLAASLCGRWIEQGHYTALLARVDGAPAGVVTIAESHALYAGGKIGIIQECYVAPAFRSHGVGAALIGAAHALAAQRDWACIELCTPPLPEFERSLAFYQKFDFRPVGGRKMRRQCRDHGG